MHNRHLFPVDHASTTTVVVGTPRLGHGVRPLGFDEMCAAGEAASFPSSPHHASPRQRRRHNRRVVVVSMAVACMVGIGLVAFLFHGADSGSGVPKALRSFAHAPATAALVTPLFREGAARIEHSPLRRGGRIHAGCFPANATVMMDDHSFRRMDQLKVGDRIAVVDPATGATAFDDVYALGHANHEAKAMFVRIVAATGDVINLTPDHLLFAVAAAPPPSSSDAHDDGIAEGSHSYARKGWPVSLPDGSTRAAQLVRADQVERGWVVFTADNEPTEFDDFHLVLQPHTVVHTDVHEGVGLFTPHTLQFDTVLVDGVAASSFTDNGLGPFLGRLGLAPWRAAFQSLPMSLAQSAGDSLLTTLAEHDASKSTLLGAGRVVNEWLDSIAKRTARLPSAASSSSSL